MKLVVVIPVCNEENTLEALLKGILVHTPSTDCEVVFVDDGSTDQSYRVLTGLHERFKQVRVLKFRRNFGKTLALAAAFRCIEGDVVVTMDGDLQDDPAEIPKLLAKLDEGYDLVCGWKADRRDPWHKTIPSRVYNAGIAWLFGHKLHDINTGFKAMRMEVAKQLPMYGEMHRMIVVNALALGYKVAEVPVKHHPRRFGKSQFGLERFHRGVADALTTWFLNRHGQAPNHFFYLAGFLTGAVGKIMLLAGVLGVIGFPWIETYLGFRLTLLLVCVGFGLGFSLICASLQAFMSGLLAELIIRRDAAVPIDARIEQMLASSLERKRD